MGQSLKSLIANILWLIKRGCQEKNMPIGSRIDKIIGGSKIQSVHKVEINGISADTFSMGKYISAGVWQLVGADLLYRVKAGRRITGLRAAVPNDE